MMLFERLRNVRSILACQSRIVPKNHTILHEAGHGTHYERSKYRLIDQKSLPENILFRHTG